MDAVVEFPFELHPPLRVERPEGSGTYVRLSDDARACVAYLGIPEINQDQEIKPIGTGFFVRHEGSTYIVTAAHVAKDLTDVAFGVRLNTKEGGGRIDRLDEGYWKNHPTDELVDVAILPYEIPAWADAIPFGKWFVTEFKRKTKDFGAGDLVYIVGVYKFLHGVKRNMPAVHTGYIAAMADGEEIYIADWRAAEPDKADLIPVYGHLIQAPTLPASSGSPVFVRRSIQALIPDPAFEPPKGTKPGDKVKVPLLKTWRYGSVWLLGLWQGAWGDVTRMVSLPDGAVDMGTGMGVCVPAIKILEALEHPDLVELRRKKKQETAKKSALSLQSARVAHAGDAILRTMLDTPPARKAKASKKGG